MEFKEKSPEELQQSFSSDEAANIIPGPNPAQETLTQIKHSDDGYLEILQAGFESTAIKNIYDRLKLDEVISTPGVFDEPEFSIKDHPDLSAGMTVEDMVALERCNSTAQATLLRDQIQQDRVASEILANQGFGGTVAGLAGSLVDIDLPLTFMVPEAAFMSKLKNVGRLGASATMALKGAAAAETVEGAKLLVSPVGDWRDLGMAGIAGLGLGGTLGMFGKRLSKEELDLLRVTQKHLDDAERTFHTDASPEGDARMAGQIQEPSAPPKINLEDSIGAASTIDPDFVPDLVDESVIKMREQARGELAAKGLGVRAEEAFPDTPIGRKAALFKKALDSTPLKDTFSRLWDSKSFIAKKLAYDLLESSEGIVRNNTSAAVLSKMYQTRMLKHLQSYEDNLTAWIKETGANEGAPVWFARLNPTVRDKYNQAVRIELAMRESTQKGTQGIPKTISDMADKIDAMSAEARDILRGREGQEMVRGADTLSDTLGYFPQHVDGNKIIRLITNKVLAHEDVISAFKEAYRGMHPDWSEEILDKLAKAQVRRASTFATHVDSNMYRMLDQEGESFVLQYLTDSGIKRTDAEAMVAGLKARKPENQKIGALRHKISMDVLTPIPNSDLRLVDLMYNDVPEVMFRYSKSVAGAGALARKGYQYSDRANTINAILAEQAATRGSKPVSTEDLENMFSYFGGGPLSGGVTPWVRRALSLTGLSIFGGIGLAQFGEFGAGIAAFGFQRYQQALIKELGKLSKQELNQVSHLVAAVDGEDKLFMEQFHYDMLQRDKGFWAEGGRALDSALAAGRRAQGILTGFYWVKQLQQRCALRSMLHGLWDMAQGDQVLSKARLYDIGLDERTTDNILKYFKDGTVTKEADGSLNLNLHSWRPQDEEALGAALNRHVDQVVQNALAGEETPWMHKMAGAILMQGKAFTTLAMRKQTIRNLRIEDEASKMAFVWCLSTAMAGYAAQQTLAGNTDELSPIKLVKGAINYSNMTAWVPQLWDPTMGVLGIDSLKMSKFNMNARNDIIGAPPVFGTMNRLAHLPFAAARIITPGMEYSNADVNALQAAPIFGNLAWLKGLTNALKEEK